MNRTPWIASVCLALSFSVAAAAATPAITAAVNARKANYKEIGGAFKAVNDEIKSGAPHWGTVRPLAKELAARSVQQVKYFPRGSGPESGLKTRAKAVIWNEQAQFVKIQRDMVAAANALQAAADKGDVAALTAARTSLGATCKACHDRYREPDA